MAQAGKAFAKALPIAKLDRLEAQVAELRQIHVALSEAFTHCRCTMSNQAPDLPEPPNDSD
ncbi:hypothetical protein ACFVWG_29575 [Kribbella sp. NPDC058245]|uniref:hypothetical protein n=1 Tax=Kribbella sp. NPDC058245 TaxID=3346399 RepID=UPI0036E40B41